MDRVLRARFARLSSRQVAGLLACAVLLLQLPDGAAGFEINIDIEHWLQHPPYEHGGTVKEQIQCYALPYGGIGFASHALTYLTVVCLALGRNPLWPFRKLGNKVFNIVVSVIGLLITLPLTVLTMLRCRNEWQFILIAVWKLVLSLTLSTISIHAAAYIQAKRKTRRGKAARRGAYGPVQSSVSLPGSETDRLRGDYGADEEELEKSSKEDSKKKFRNVLWWLIPYFLGAVVGFVGVMHLVRNNFASNNRLRIITYAFAGVAGFPFALALIIAAVVEVAKMCRRSRSERQSISKGIGDVLATSFGMVIGLMIFVAALFSFYVDWVLAALADDLVGYPSSENAVFYWTYFAAKRLPMLSF